MKIYHTFARIYVHDMEKTLLFYETLLQKTCQSRFVCQQVNLEIAQLDNLLLVAGSEQALKPFQSTRATFLVDSIDEWETFLVGNGAKIVKEKKSMPSGYNMTVQHPDGTLAEYVQQNQNFLASDPRIDAPTFFDVLHGRRAVRTYNPSAKIPREELTVLLREAALAPSGGNLQTWRFLVVDSSDGKEKLSAAAFHQKQITTASAVVIVLGDLKGYQLADKIYMQAAAQGTMPAEAAKSLAERYTRLYSGMEKEDILQTVSVDCALASMQFMLAAYAKGYDTVPMRGYDKERLMDSFHIPDRYVPVLLIAVGKAAEPAVPTIRLPAEDIVHFNALPQN